LNERVYGDEFVEDEFASEVVIESVNVDESEELKPPRIEAKAAIVIDADTGRVLYEKDAYSRRAIASTTKIMTAIVAIENGNLDDKVKVSSRAASIWVPQSSSNRVRNSH